MTRIESLRDKSIEIITTNQHKSGAYIASPTFSTYNYCWLRDGCFTAYSMDIWGRVDSSNRFFDWTDKVISGQASRLDGILQMKERGDILLNSDYLPSRFKPDGNECNDEWPNFQLDGYGTWLWALTQHIKLTGDAGLLSRYRKSIDIVIEYLTNFWQYPNFDCWQENGEEIHTSTLAAIYGGLRAINEFVNDNKIDNTADNIKDYVKSMCIIDGRLKKCTDLDAIDASLIWAAVPFGLFDVKDLEFVNTITEIENKLVHDGGVHRYSEDTYYGGGEWIIMSAWLGWYYCLSEKHDKAKLMLEWIESKKNRNGELAEQSLEHVNNEQYINRWKSLWGEVATPVLWSHAMYLILLSNINNQVN